MTTVTLSASPRGNGYQATISFSDGVWISSAEAFPSIGEAVAAAATKLLDMPDRLARLDLSSTEIDASC
jgi:hypothetical protein